ncbi:FGGY carbohydrate kinase domain-containing protein-like [Macadamia integrifolia]|uniref:FGGY carbohydrate kinase domain-containing protein-like n=1 Tax=Macadamia integrifolia TaxID=60698 RepID=UPI001C4F85A7|nr:FGGY carbohydrate kinase domain-containing protein-like [Macadamia integrifolia]
MHNGLCEVIVTKDREIAQQDALIEEIAQRLEQVGVAFVDFPVLHEDGSNRANLNSWTVNCIMVPYLLTGELFSCISAYWLQLMTLLYLMQTGRSVAFPGHSLGSGLTPAAAKELGLAVGTPVGTSLIDAHAGGVGVIESVPASESESKGDDKNTICHRMVLVCGTSTCHMAVSQRKIFIPGIWGPFWSAMVPEYWLTEGGQSATGALLDYVVENHVASPHLANRAASQGISIYELLNRILESMMNELKAPFLAALTKDIHVLPDFHGNRSPIADPKSKGMVCGLTLDKSEKQLTLLYLATVQGIAYGTRHIVEHCNSQGHKIDTLLACGGLAKNPLYIQEHADIIGCPLILPRESESVLLGASILGAVAAKKYSSLHDAMKALNAPGQVIHPSKDPILKKYHDAKYRVFQELYEQQLSRRKTMAEALA